jgi:glycogen debranching enzyme
MATGMACSNRDVRHLSKLAIRVDDCPLDVLTSRRVDYFSARAVCTKQDSGDDEPPLTIRRDRFVSEGVHEDLVLENLSREAQQVKLEISYASDFAHVMEAQEDGNGSGMHWQEPRARSVVLWAERDGYRRGTALTFSRAGEITNERARFDLDLRRGERWSLCIDMTPIVDGVRCPPLLRCGSFHEHASKMPMPLDRWLEDAPQLECDHILERIYRQSLLDLAALRVRPDDVTIKWAMPGGGLPWFMTVFGRDSVITSYQALPFHQENAQATLEALAELQATDWDNWRDAEPGKILHELRRGTLAETGASRTLRTTERMTPPCCG